MGKKLDKDLAMVKALAYEHFGTNFSTFKEDNKYGLAVHYPEVEIANSEGLKHTIKDLYIILFFSESSKGRLKLTYSAIHGMRGKISFAEFNSGYAHSHLNGIQRGYSNFCLGGSEIAYAIEELCDDFSADNLDFVFSFFPILASWESLEGSPYKRIRNIKMNNSSGAFPTNVEISRVAHMFIPYTVIEYSNGQYNLIRIDFDSVPQSLYREIGISSSIFEHNTGMFNREAALSRARNFNKEALSIFEYKGEYVKLTIDLDTIPNTENLNSEDLVLVPSEHAKYAILTKLKEKYESIKRNKAISRMESFWKPKALSIREILPASKLSAFFSQD